MVGTKKQQQAKPPLVQDSFILKKIQAQVSLILSKIVKFKNTNQKKKKNKKGKKKRNESEEEEKEECAQNKQTPFQTISENETIRETSNNKYTSQIPYSAIEKPVIEENIFFGDSKNQIKQNLSFNNSSSATFLNNNDDFQN